MRAIRIHEFGSIDIIMLDPISCPVPAVDDVLVAVKAAGVGPRALLVVVQILDGRRGATLGVVTIPVIASFAKRARRFNVAQGLVDTLSRIGASLRTSMSGSLSRDLAFRT